MAGGGRARARLLVTTIAQAPSVSSEQSSRWRGSAIMREFSTSSTVIGSRKKARGLREAFSRWVTATRAKCSGFAPNSCM